MGNKNFVLIRGLNRGNIHWADFPEILLQKIPNAKIEFLEIAGNGTRFNEISPVNAEECLSDLRSKVSFLKNGEKFYLISISLAGMISMLWADRFPNDLNGVVVINSSLGQFSKPWERLNFKNTPRLFPALLSKNTYQKELTILEATSAQPDRIQKFLKPYTEFSDKYPTKFSNLIRQLILANSIKIINTNRLKTLILVGLNDKFVNPNCSYKISKRFNFKLEENAQSAHDLPLDDPNWLADKIVQFIN
jgi:pimeloyl-ACP methyl ester carboxylesterase